MLLEAKNLTKHFGAVQAVDEVTFSIAQGETLALVGESGCGKSTLGRLLLRLLEPDQGEVLYQGENILKKKKEEMRKLRRELQIIFQDPYASLNPRFTVEKTLAEPFKVYRLFQGKDLRGEVAELLGLVGLSESFLKRFPHELSGGERQRVGIARALSLKPKFMVADEPVSALDPSIQIQILNLILELKKKRGLTYLFIAHDLAVVSRLADRVAVMHLGKIVEVALKRDFYKNPLHPYSRALLEATPVPDPFLKRKVLSLKGELPSPIHPPSGCRFHPRCPQAMEVCRRIEPEFREAASGHLLACLLIR